MGLDIYLEGHKHVGNWDHMPEEEKQQFAALLKLMGWTEDMVSVSIPMLSTTITLAHWRSHSIFGWFAENLGEGRFTENSESMHVELEDIKTLVKKARQALELYNAGEEESAYHILPHDGFSGGEAYCDNLASLIQQCENLADLPDMDFSFKANW